MQDKTRRVFQDFVDQAERLRRYNFEEHVKKVGLGFKVTRREDGLFDVYYGIPDDKERDAFLLTLRMFIQQSDEIGISQLNRFNNDPGVSNHWKTEYRKIVKFYNRFLHDRPRTISDDFFEGSPTNEDILDKMLYGGIAHISRNHPEKRERLLAWTKDVHREAVLHQEFTIIILVISKLIYVISDLCQNELSSNDI